MQTAKTTLIVLATLIGVVFVAWNALWLLVQFPAVALTVFVLGSGFAVVYRRLPQGR